MVSVATETVPSRVASKKSPSGTKAIRTATAGRQG